MSKQSGNMLFILLVAIALLGALTAILVRSDSTSDDTGSSEQISIATSKLMTTMSSIESAVDMLIARGCSENTISLIYDRNGDGVVNASDWGVNPNSPADNSCHVFHPNGAGLTLSNKLNPVLMGTTAYPNKGITFTAANRISGVGVNGSPELIMQIYDVKDEVCNIINKAAGISGIPNNGSNFAPGAGAFVGTFSSSGWISVTGGQKMGCFFSTSGGASVQANVAYIVLIVK